MKYSIYKKGKNCWFKMYKDVYKLRDLIELAILIERTYIYNRQLENKRIQVDSYLKNYKVIVNDNHNDDYPIVHYMGWL